MANRGTVDLRKIVNSSSIHKEFKGAVALAAKHGWTGRQTGAGGISMLAPDGKARTYVPSSIRDGGTAARKIIRDIEKWAEARDAEAIEESLTKVAEGVGLTRDEVEARHGPDPTISCKEHGVEFMSWEGLSEHVRTVHVDHTDPVSEAIRAADQADEEEPVRVEDMKFEGDPEEDSLDALLDGGAALTDALSSSASAAAKMDDESVRPWRAVLNRNDDGTVNLYETETVLEVTTAGGKKVFRCSLESCGFEAALPRSVTAHYSHHVRAGEAEPVDKERPIVEANVRPKFYTQEGLAQEVLSREIYVAMRSRRRHTDERVSDYADALAEKIVRNRLIAGEVVTEGIVQEVVQSDAEVLLGKLRELLGVNSADEIAALREELANETAARESAEAKSKRLGETLRTMAELASEETE